MMAHENVLARYKVLNELGRGAISAVYAARTRTTGVGIALKRLDPALLNDSNAYLAERFLKRARSAKLLKHRNIVETYDAGEAGGTVYVAMEMLEGESLRSILDRGPLPVARAIRVAHDIASALAYAHLQGVVHGGIKPSNVIVLRSGVAKLTDFGIGQAALLLAAPGGRLSYTSPEQLRGEAVDHRCDVFSLGALLYEMLSGRTPFQGDSAKEILDKVLHAKPSLPSELNPHVPRAVDAIVLGMIGAQPAARMAGMPLLLRELEQLEYALGLGAAPSARADEPAAPVKPAAAVTPAVPVQPAARMQPAASVPPAAPVQPAASVPQAPPVPQVAPVPPARPSANEALRHAPRTTDREVFDYHAAIAIMERESRTQRSSRSRPALFAAFVLGFAALGIGVAGYLGVGVTGFMDRVGLAGFVDDWLGPGKLAITAGRLQEAPAAAPAPAPAASRPAAPPPVAEIPQKVAELPQKPVSVPAPDPVPPPPPMSAQPAPRPVAPPQVAEMAQEPMTAPAPEPVRAQPAAARAAPAQQPASAAQPTAQVKEQQPGGTARLVVAVSPRGEIWIDGKHHGTTPPITTLDLEPGIRQIEIRSGSRKPYLTYMVVQAGDVRRIRHDFNAKPSGPRTAKLESPPDRNSGHRR